MFEDRKDAGERLARALEKYKNKKVLVLAIPRGGVEVGYEVAKYLNADLSIVVSRKLPYPDNPEAGFGAIAEDGSTFIFEDAKRWLSEETIDRIMEEQKQPEIINRVVILVDDGLAMGSTMRASIMLCRNKKAGKIIVAAPVSGRAVAEEIGKIVDEVVILEKPVFFQAVAQVYRNWYDVSDREVIEIMERWQSEQKDGDFMTCRKMQREIFKKTRGKK